MPMGWQQQEPADLNILHARTGGRGDGRGCGDQHAMMRTRMAGNLTGNHEPRNHSIRVPTTPGEPVRGYREAFQ